jgi:hypothetical protein
MTKTKIDKPKRPGRKKKEPFTEPMPAGKDKQTGQFVAGNRWWEARSSHGAKPAFVNPEDLRDACYQYIEWAGANPLKEEKVFCANGLVTRVEVAKMRAMTLGGMCIYIGVNPGKWSEYKKNPDFGEVTREIEGLIYDQKFSGAAADMLNANIIARDLGLADKKELTGKDGGPVEHNYTISDALAEKLAKVIKE